MTQAIRQHDVPTSSQAPSSATLTLERERTLFKQNRFIAMPLAGTIVWAILGLTAPFVSKTPRTLL